MTRTLSREDARRFYDRFGAKQDRQGFYEDAALDWLVRHGNFAAAQAVFELGCGTGRLAARLLSEHLPPSARYVAIDLSSTMVRLAGARLAAFGRRCEIHPSPGGFDFSAWGGRFDRVVCTYVLDLLGDAEIDAALAGAHAALRQGGFFCYAGLTTGIGPLSTASSTLWTLVHRINPALVGGCRPLVLADRLAQDRWRVAHRQVVVGATIPSEVLIATAI